MNPTESFPKVNEEKPPYCQICGGPHSTILCPESKEKLLNPELSRCGKCGKKGHSSNECPDRINPDIRCDSCGGKHKTAEHDKHDLIFKKDNQDKAL